MLLEMCMCVCMYASMCVHVHACVHASVWEWYVCVTQFPHGICHGTVIKAWNTLHAVKLLCSVSTWESREPKPEQRLMFHGYCRDILSVLWLKSCEKLLLRAVARPQSQLRLVIYKYGCGFKGRVAFLLSTVCITLFLEKIFWCTWPNIDIFQ